MSYNYNQVNSNSIISQISVDDRIIPFYQILGLPPYTSLSDIKKLWETKKRTPLTNDEKLAFQILLVYENKIIYDKCLQKGIKANFQALEIEYEELVRERKNSIVRQERKDLKQNLELINQMKTADRFQKTFNIAFLFRFIKNKEGYWVNAKDDQIKNQNEIIIIQQGDTYYYHITENGLVHLVSSKQLFWDFNKSTKLDGSRLDSQDAVFTLCGNLFGYFCEINDIKGSPTKLEYFRTKTGNDYNRNKRFANEVVFKRTDLNFYNIYQTNEIIITPQENNLNIQTILRKYENQILNGHSITDEARDIVLKDVETTEPRDLQQMRRLLTPLK